MTKKPASGQPRFGRALAFVVVVGSVTMTPTIVQADEGGVSFWIPGLFGSLAASPLVPGFAVSTTYYHTSVNAGADVAFARQVSRGNLQVNFTGNLAANLKAEAELPWAVPSYTFAERFLGGQATVMMLVPYGTTRTSVDTTLTGNLGLGGPGFTISPGTSDRMNGFGDLYPMFTLRWNQGVDNYMLYATGNLTVGRYHQQSLANLGIGHNAFDAGGSYTYLDQKSGMEFSATLGFTFNFENTHTQYQNGVDMHLDMGASRFLTKQLQLGLVAYGYQQVSCDSGSGDRVGCFESRVFGAGPQVGYIIPIDEHLQGYLNIKAYKEFGEQHRPAGWNTWVTFAISPAPPEEKSKTTTPMMRK